MLLTPNTRETPMSETKTYYTPNRIEIATGDFISKVLVANIGNITNVRRFENLYLVDVIDYSNAMVIQKAINDLKGKQIAFCFWNDKTWCVAATTHGWDRGD